MHPNTHAPIAILLALAGSMGVTDAVAGQPADRPAMVPTRSVGVLYINLATGERSLTHYNIADPAEIHAVNTATLFDYWMSIDENPCWDDSRADGFAVQMESNTGGPPDGSPDGIMEGGTSGGLTQPVVMWDYGDLPFDSEISGIIIKIATTAIDDIDSNGDGTLDSGIDSVSVFYDGLSEGAKSSNAPPTAVIRVEAVPGRLAADEVDTEVPDFDIVFDFGGSGSGGFELGDSDGLNQGALYLPGAAPGFDVSSLITTCTTTSLGGVGTDCTLVPNPNADGLADFQYLQYYTKHDSNSKVTSASTYISLGTPEGTVEISTYVTTTYDCSTSGGRFTTCSSTYNFTSTFFTPDSLPQGQSAFESFGIGSLASNGSTNDIDPIGETAGCCYWFGGLDCAGFLDQLVEEPQFNETYYNFTPYTQVSIALLTGNGCPPLDPSERIGGSSSASFLCDPCAGIDFNGDTVLDNGDIGAFIVLFLSQDPVADLNGDGILDNGDIGTFIEMFLACAG